MIYSSFFIVLTRSHLQISDETFRNMSIKDRYSHQISQTYKEKIKAAGEVISIHSYSPRACSKTDSHVHIQGQNWSAPAGGIPTYTASAPAASSPAARPSAAAKPAAALANSGGGGKKKEAWEHEWDALGSAAPTPSSASASAGAAGGISSSPAAASRPPPARAAAVQQHNLWNGSAETQQHAPNTTPQELPAYLRDAPPSDDNNNNNNNNNMYNSSSSSGQPQSQQEQGGDYLSYFSAQLGAYAKTAADYSSSAAQLAAAQAAAASKVIQSTSSY